MNAFSCFASQPPSKYRPYLCTRRGARVEFRVLCTDRRQASYRRDAILARPGQLGWGPSQVTKGTSAIRFWLHSGQHESRLEAHQCDFCATGIDPYAPSESVCSKCDNSAGLVVVAPVVFCRAERPE